MLGAFRGYQRWVSVVLGREVVGDESAFDRAIMIGGPGVAESPPS